MDKHFHFIEDKDSETSVILSVGTWEQSYFYGTQKSVPTINLETYIFRVLVTVISKGQTACKLH